MQLLPACHQPLQLLALRKRPPTGLRAPPPGKPFLPAGSEGAGREEVRRLSVWPWPVGTGAPVSVLANAGQEWESGNTVALLQLHSRRPCSSGSPPAPLSPSGGFRVSKRGQWEEVSWLLRARTPRGHHVLHESCTRRIPFVNSQAFIECCECLPKLFFKRQGCGFFLGTETSAFALNA